MRQLMYVVMAPVLSIGAMLAVNIVRADPPASQPAPDHKPTSIFDFGLEPLPTSDADKGKSDGEKVDKAPAKPDKAPAPSDPPPAKPDKASAPSDPPAPPAPAPQPPGQAGRMAPDELKDFLKACHIDAQGVITTDQIVTLGIRGTEGKHFILTGEFYLAPEPTPFKNGQMYFHLRQRNGKQCIDLSVNGMRVKRILLAGAIVKKFAYPMKFDGLPPQTWQPMKIDAGADGIFVQFGHLHGVSQGPVATEGANNIIFGPGAKLRNLKVEILPK